MHNIGILLINSDQPAAVNIKNLLLENEYKVIYLAYTAEEGLRVARKFKPGIIISEIDLPDSDGISLCRELRKEFSLMRSYIVICSVNSENYIVSSALNAGADDFLRKPVNNMLFLSKLNAWNRRFVINEKTCQEDKSNLIIDFDRYIVKVNNREIELPRKEFEILTLLYSHQKKVFTREEIKNEVWQVHSQVKSRTIDVHIKKLREKIGSSFIKTIKGFGYRLDLSGV